MEDKLQEIWYENRGESHLKWSYLHEILKVIWDELALVVKELRVQQRKEQKDVKSSESTGATI